jgi:hypothetical protein
MLPPFFFCSVVRYLTSPINPGFGPEECCRDPGQPELPGDLDRRGQAPNAMA